MPQMKSAFNLTTYKEGDMTVNKLSGPAFSEVFDGVQPEFGRQRQ